jgi:hypothetical protein
MEQLTRLAQDGHLYAILDATDMRSVPEKMGRLGEQRALSLYKGTSVEGYWAVAPYLAVVDEKLLHWIKREASNFPWGIFAVSNQPLGAIFEHCRSQLVVVLADKKYWFFRYYDPRVLERHLLRRSRRDLIAFFGPVQAYITASGAEFSGKAFFPASATKN